MMGRQSPHTSSQQLSSRSPANPRPAAPSKLSPETSSRRPMPSGLHPAIRPWKRSPHFPPAARCMPLRQSRCPPSAVCDARADIVLPSLSSCTRAILAESASQQFKQSCASSVAKVTCQSKPTRYRASRGVRHAPCNDCVRCKNPRTGRLANRVRHRRHAFARAHNRGVVHETFRMVIVPWNPKSCVEACWILMILEAACQCHQTCWGQKAVT